MTISSTTSAPTHVPPVYAQKANAGRDADGDTDGSKAAGKVEKAATVQKTASTSTLGSIINTTA